MPLTPAQRTTLKTFIQATYPTLNDQQIADALNTLAAPDFWVWRTAVSKHEYTQGTGPEGTTFTWTSTGYIGRSVGERDAFREIFNDAGVCNPSRPNVRQAFVDIFSGAQAEAVANRAHCAATSRRKATVAEKVLATGTGSTGSPGLMGFEGPLSVDDVVSALG
jgi:hypothetical protein